MTCDPNSLIQAANCFQCLSHQQLEMVKAYLLCQILQNGGTSTGTQLVPYTVAPPPNPTDPTKPAWAYDPTGNLPSLGWNTNTLSWN